MTAIETSVGRNEFGQLVVDVSSTVGRGRLVLQDDRVSVSGDLAWNPLPVELLGLLSEAVRLLQAESEVGDAVALTRHLLDGGAFRERVGDSSTSE